ncbi:MAG: PAS domain S-box protein [Planktothrix sp. GU0601_MAG3]|nr:MAG: PAS domain S-box protein [Planktothrix sp. GU0601_MAG3]
MTTSEVCASFQNGGYQVIQSPTWDTQWQIDQFLGVIHDLILIIDCEQQKIHVLPTEAAPNLSSELNVFYLVLQELQNPQESSEFLPLVRRVIETQVAQNIIYKCYQYQKDYQILVEIYPLSKTEVIAVIKDLSQCSTVKAVPQKVSKKKHSPTPTSTPTRQITKECLKKQIEERQRIETQLQTRKTELEKLMDNAGDCIVRLDQKLRYLFVNRRTAALIQIAQEKFIGKTNWELGISDPVAREWEQNCQQVLDTGQPQQFEFDLETAEGLRSLQTLIVPEIQQGGQVKTLLATTRDITQQKRTFAETQRQNQFLNLLTKITSKVRQSLELDLILKTTVEEVQKVLNVDRVIMLKLDPQRGGTVVQEAVIPQWSSLLSQRIYTPELTPYLCDAAVPDQVIIFSDIDQENLDNCYLQLIQYFQVKASLIVPIWLEKKEIDSIITPSKNPESTNNSSDPKPKLWGFLMTHQCAEPRQWETLETNFLKQLADQVGIALKQAQLIAELKQTHQCLSCHFDNSPLVVIEWDQQLKIKRWSSQAERIFGWTSAEVLGQKWSSFQGFFATDVLKVTQEMIQLIDGTNNHQIIEAQNRTKDGRVINCEWYNSVVRDEGGNLVSLLSLAQNVSDRKQAEQELVNSEERFRTIFEQAAVGFALIDLSGELLRVNQRYCEITGYSEKDLIGKTVHNFIHYPPNSEGMDWLEQIADQDLLETFSIEKQYIRPNGQRNWVQIFVSTLDQLWQGKKYILLALEDIQERKQTEEALRKSEETVATGFTGK